ncbi:hypothetical protein [Brevundimonas sp.]|jgi:hypothetical protein|uniref:hypothetical protein n=1 Tax=Brevundimonas sp. TaxID=1871086 RepID=UPI003782D8D2
MAISDFFSGGQTPDYLSGLLDDEQLRRLKQNAQQNALMQFGLSALAQGGYSQTPVGIGEILGKSGMAGMQGYQQGIQSGIEGIGTRARLEELKRKRDQQAQIDTMIGGITDPEEALAARLAPEQYITAKFKPKSSFNILTDEQAAAYKLPTDSGQRYQMTDKGVELISGTQTKDAAATTLEKLQTYRTTLVNANPKDPRIKQIDAAINKETNFAPGIQVNYGQPVAGVDANGNPVFFQPAKGGGAPSIVPGVAPLREEKAPTESQAKAEAFGSQMKSASAEFEQIQKEGFVPGATMSQAQVELAGTPLRGLADPLAQRTQQSQSQWAEAYLRYKTGAAATEGEVKRNIDTFFPKIGETDPKVIEQKSRMRKQAEQDVLKSAKPSAQQKLKLTPVDQQALDWANKNPTDARAIAIKKKLGVN